MKTGWAEPWKQQFFETIKEDRFADDLRSSSLDGRLKDWTRVLTAAVVESCGRNDLITAAKGHPLRSMPEQREEYLGVDVMSFQRGDGPWHFPVVVIELENSPRDDRIAYSLWKLMNIRAKLRVVFCYRLNAEDGAALVHKMSEDVVRSMKIEDRTTLHGETLMSVGYRNLAETFPYGFFKWWMLNVNTGAFEQY